MINTFAIYSNVQRVDSYRIFQHGLTKYLTKFKVLDKYFFIYIFLVLVFSCTVRVLFPTRRLMMITLNTDFSLYSISGEVAYSVYTAFLVVLFGETMLLPQWSLTSERPRSEPTPQTLSQAVPDCDQKMARDDNPRDATRAPRAPCLGAYPGAPP